MEDIVGCVSNQSLSSPHPLLFHWLAAHMAADFWHICLRFDHTHMLVNRFRIRTYSFN